MPPDKSEKLIKADIDFSNPEVKQILSLINRQQKDSLVTYMTDDQLANRYLSLSAFASIRDSNYIDTIGHMLRDKNLNVMSLAAFVLGQQKHSRSESYLLNAFESKDTTGFYSTLNSTILEAIGKCGSEKMLHHLSTINSYSSLDTALLEGQSRGIYQFMLRGLTLPIGTDAMLKYATEPLYPESVRLIASNYLARANNLDLSEKEDDLLLSLSIETDPYIKIALIKALKYSKSDKTFNALSSEFNKERNTAIRIELLKALRPFEYNKKKQILFNALAESNQRIAEVASIELITQGNAIDATTYQSKARLETRTQVKINLYHAALNNLPIFYRNTRFIISGELEKLYLSITNSAYQAQVITALGKHPPNHTRIKNIGLKSSEAIVRSSSIRSLGVILSQANLNQYFGPSYLNIQRSIVEDMFRACESEDVGMITEAALVLADTSQTYQQFVDTNRVNELIDVQKKLSLPKEIETFQALATTIANISGRLPNNEQIVNHRPISSTILTGLNVETNAEIVTSKGIIALRLLPTKAPLTCMNFVALAEAGFYDGRSIHRVVPNFVIQGGCPRGDGYGATEYTMPSEFSDIHYDKAGYVGMASAGPHTESCQWFITSAPTLHLDGRYTIFAQVTRGLDIISDTSIGDIIHDIKILE